MDQESSYYISDKLSVYLKTSTKADLYDDFKRLRESICSKKFVRELFEQMPKDLATVFLQDAERLYGQTLWELLVHKFITDATTFTFFYDEERELLGCFRAPIGSLSEVFQSHFQLQKQDEEHFENQILSFSPSLQKELMNPTYKQLYDIVVSHLEKNNATSVVFFSSIDMRDMLIEEMRRLCKEKYGDTTRED